MTTPTTCAYLEWLEEVLADFEGEPTPVDDLTVVARACFRTAYERAVDVLR